MLASYSCSIDYFSVPPIKQLNIVKSFIYWDITLCNQVKVSRRYGTIYASIFRFFWLLHDSCGVFLHILFDLEDWADIFLRKFDFYRIIWRCIPGDRKFHSHGSGNLRSNKLMILRVYEPIPDGYTWPIIIMQNFKR